MSTKVVRLNQAERMMTYLKIDTERRRILVRFADGMEGWIDAEEVSSSGKLDLESVNLPNPHEIEIATDKGDTIKIPWDFARHYCDPEYREREVEQRDQGRSVLGEKVASIRKEKEFTQEELAQAADIGRATLSRLENGEVSPRYETLEKVAKALQVKTPRLLTGE